MLLSAVALLTVSAAGQSLADGIAAVEAGRYAEGEQILTAFVRTQPDSAEGYLYLGLAHFRSGQAAAARPYLERATKLAPTDARAWKMLGLVTTPIDLEAAVPALQKACELAPKDEEACYYLARTQYAGGHYEAARGAFEKAVRAATPETLPRVHRAVALNFVALSNVEEAERHFKMAIQLAGKKPRETEDARVDYGAFLFRQGRVQDALIPLEQAAQDVPQSVRAHVELGRVLLHAEKLEKAAASLERAIKMEPGNWNAHLLLGRVYLRMGRTAEGEREMRLGQEGWGAKKF